MKGRKVQVLRGKIEHALDAPPSKSVTHRALATAALADGDSTLRRALDADDTRRTADGLSALGVHVERIADGFVVRGTAGHVPGGGSLDLGNSGTSLRFLLALAALGERPSRLDGSARLRERPIGPLAEVLKRLGARIEPVSEPRLPLTAGGRRPTGGPVEVPAAQSSQFASAVMLIGTRLSGGLELQLTPGVVSGPYVELTAEVLRDFGATVERTSPRSYRVAERPPRGREYVVEGDWSSASYWLALPLIAGGEVVVYGLRGGSQQPDAAFLDILETLGAEVVLGEDAVAVRARGGVRPFDVDLTDSPDLAPTLAVLALHSEGPCRIGGVSHLRLKESDRLALLEENLVRLGRAARAGDGELTVAAPLANTGRARGAEGERVIRTGGDHRIAMAFALAGLGRGSVVIDDADCVAKSYPGFWKELDRLIESSVRTGS